MTSTQGTPNGDFDERLAEALASTLIEGEQVVAQEVGDQGQAIVLTDSRIILLREGLAATGELNGHKASVFALAKVSEVNLRKGPLGAVIQIVAESAQAPEGGRPDNVIVFTGPGRVKKAEAFASTVESASGKIVNRVEPTHRPEQPSEQPVVVEASAEPPKAGRKKRSLAEEIYSEVVEASAQAAEVPAQSAQAPTSEPAPQPIAAMQAEEIVEEESEPEPVDRYGEFNPNPRLPKPARKRVHGPNRVLVALGVLASLVFVGMAVMAPLREASTPRANVATGGGSNDIRHVQLQAAAIVGYLSDVNGMLRPANSEVSAFRNAVRAGNKSSITTTSRLDATDKAWQDLSALKAPPGLAEAQQNLMDGLVARKNAVAAAAAASVSGDLDARDTLSRLDAADAKVRNAVSAIEAARVTIQKQMEKAGVSGKKEKGQH